MSENETKQKKEAKVRTSITINPEVLDNVRKFCEDKGRSVSSFIEEVLQASLSANR
jgi:hypothetical protein